MVLFGSCLEALEHRQLNPASCCIPALLSATAPPSQSIVYQAYGVIMPCRPCTIITHLPPQQPCFPLFFRLSLERTGVDVPKGTFYSYNICTLTEQQAIIGSHTQALAPSALVQNIPKSKCSLAKNPVNLPSLRPSETILVGTVRSQMSGWLTVTVAVPRCALTVPLMVGPVNGQAVPANPEQ